MHPFSTPMKTLGVLGTNGLILVKHLLCKFVNILHHKIIDLQTARLLTITSLLQYHILFWSQKDIKPMV